MTTAILRALALNEVRLRLRRVSTLVTLLAVVGVSWLMIPDPHSGNALLKVAGARVLNTSAALALGSASFAGLVFGLGGFFLVRGRMSEDIRSGCGGVIATTTVGNGLFLFSRWLGGVAYLFALIVAFMGTILVCHVLRGDGPIQLPVYLQTYSLMLVPLVFFAVSMAILFDSFAPLLGKAGDVIFVVLWMAQMAIVPVVIRGGEGALPGILVLDFSGMAAAQARLQSVLHTSNLNLGVSPYDARLPAVMLPAAMWSSKVVLLRCGAAALALLPLAPAGWLFHRFSPDRVKVSRARPRRSALGLLNGWLQPLARLARPLFRLAGSVPGIWGQMVAEVALTLVAAPSAIVAALVLLGASLLVKAAFLGPLLMGAVAFWGVLISDVSTRDFAAATEDLTGAVAGGSGQRYLRQLGATALLGLLYTGVIALRWLWGDPIRASALVVGVGALSAVAMLFGRCSGTARTFLGLFLFGLFVAVNAPVPVIDAVGFNGVAHVQSVLTWAVIGVGAALAGFLWNRRQAG